MEKPDYLINFGIEDNGKLKEAVGPASKPTLTKRGDEMRIYGRERLHDPWGHLAPGVG
jgi:hypothetical protein